MAECRLCPRNCGLDRERTLGVCKVGNQLRIARAALHLWEEPCISGANGSGTVFFSGCNLGCVFCQNDVISHQGFGQDISMERLADIFLALQEQGAHNINLITATPHLLHILRALDRVKKQLHIPVVWNTGGYETVETIHALNGYVDVYLPDLKYLDSNRAQALSCAADYPKYATDAICEMVRQTGSYQMDQNAMLVRGTMVRHLVLPGGRKDSIAVVRWLGEHFTKEQILISLMSQYTPVKSVMADHNLSRHLTTFEYQSVVQMVEKYGFEGYTQARTSAKEEYTPPFDLEGVLPQKYS